MKHCHHAEIRVRKAAALEFLQALDPRQPAWLIAPSALALDALSRAQEQATFGWHRLTLGQLALRLAEPVLWARGLVVANRTSLQALVVRMLARAADLGRFEPLRATPGFPLALLDTLTELRGAGVPTSALPAELAGLLSAYERELAQDALADRATVLQLATEHLPTTMAPVLLYDVVPHSVLETQFARALVERAERALVTSPKGAAHAAQLALGDPISPSAAASPLAGYAGALFERETTKVEDGAVTFFSAPGEAREALEIARAARALAGEGIRFDRMAVVLREPLRYAAHLEEAFGRAQIPFFCLRGTRRPSPSGRAFLALLRCARESLSARRFAEYLAYGQVPRDDAGKPPEARGRFVAVDDELSRSLTADPDEPDELDPAPEEGASALVTGGGLRAPRAWERILVETAVLGTLERWQRRLAGRRRELDDAIAEAARTGERSEGLARERAWLVGLESFAMPLLEALTALPSDAGWNVWIEHLSRLAERALARPEPVLRALAELMPLAAIDDGSVQVALDDVLLVLEPRICTSGEPSKGSAEGAVLFASPDDLAGIDLDVVFVAGLAEKMFPARIAEDPLLLDRAREGLTLPTNAERAQAERFRLGLAVGAAQKKVILSYPRLDVQASRPRTPSFYLLELWRAHRGVLPAAEELSRHAADALDARLGWPAPRDPARALDDVEHDLGVLDRLLHVPEEESHGLARYLLGENPHLSRALRARAERWNKKKWYPSDGLISEGPLAALAPHQLAARSYSATALQNYSACPYRFYLQAIVRLAPREEPEPTYELSPLQRGSLVHEIQFAFLLELRERGLLASPSIDMEQARALLEEIVAQIANAKKDELAPAIPRVWEDQIAELRADLREWFARLIAQEEFHPAFFELAFGLPGQDGERDPRSQDEPVPLECGIALRGSIDLVESTSKHVYRATDHKTGKIRAKDGERIQGGKILQPVLYALALEQLLAKSGETANVVGGRLSYCTYAGGFANVDVPLDDAARAGATQVAKAVGAALEKRFLPALPKEDECKYCDYRPVCGPYEEIRTADKPGLPLDRKLTKPPPAQAPDAAQVLFELGQLRRFV